MKVFSVLMFSAVAVLGAFAAQASAVEVSPRIGVELGSYIVKDSDGGTAGVTAGVTVGFPYFFTDVGLETMSFEVPDPANGLTLVDGSRSEATFTVGVPVWQSLSLIGGYRTVFYGTSFLKSDSATMNGPFFGVALNNLHMGESTKDIFSIAFAAQPTTYEAKGGNFGEESDVGMSIKMGYRRAGTPHSFGIRYQVFGGDQTYDEYLTHLQYSYLF